LNRLWQALLHLHARIPGQRFATKWIDPLTTPEPPRNY
jgi:hypothetical protein